MESEGSIPNSQVLSTCPVLSQANPVHITPSQLYKVHPNIDSFPVLNKDTKEIHVKPQI
jgi:hypothetical protein